MTIKNAFKDLIEGPGPNNEVVKAVAAIAEGLVHVAADAQKFLEKPLGGDKALIPKARDDLLNGLGVGGTGRKAIENPTQPWKWF